MEKPWKVIAAFIGVFVAGAIFGAYFSLGVGSRWLAKETPPAAPVPSPVVVATPETNPKAAAPVKAPPAQRAPLLQVPYTWQAPQLLRRYAESLDLTKEQKQRIHPLIQRATEDYNRLRLNTFRETAIILERLQQDISQVLTPEQRQKLQNLEERQKARLQQNLLPDQKNQRKAGRAITNQLGGNGAAAEKAEASKPEASKPQSQTAPAASAPVETATTSSAETSVSTASTSTGSEKQQ